MVAPLYPWDKWLSKGRFTLVRGKDFICANSSMVQQIRNRASRINKKLTVEDHGDRLVCVLTPRVWRN